MVVLHIAHITDEGSSGVNVVVPQHLLNQQMRITVGILNIFNSKIDGVENQFYFSKPFRMNNLPQPFDKPDLVIFHEVYRVPYVVIAKELVEKKIPYIIFPHGCLTKQAQKQKWLKKKCANLVLFNKFMNSCVAFQFLSNSEKNRSIFKGESFIGTNGVSIPDKTNEKSFREEIRIVYIGSLFVKIKGLDLMLSAINKKINFLRNKKVNFHLYGPNENIEVGRIRKLIYDLGIEDIVTVHDAVYGEDKNRVLKNTDIFIQTSRSEGMSVGLLEALAYGIPSIVTSGTNLNDKIDQYGAGWSAETDVDSIAKAIELAVCEKNEWNLKSKNALKLIENEFSWEVVCENTIKKYIHFCNKGEVVE